jgi:hypothetical protein
MRQHQDDLNPASKRAGNFYLLCARLARPTALQPRARVGCGLLELGGGRRGGGSMLHAQCCVVLLRAALAI